MASVLAVALAAFGCGHGVPSVLPACQKTGIVKQSLPSKNFYAAHPELAAVCRLGVTRHRFLHLGSKTYFSTGAIVEGRYLVTAAHNIATLPGRQLKSIAITCGASVVRLQNPPQIFAEGKALRAAVHNPDKYWWKDYPRDYAVLDLEQIGDVPQAIATGPSFEWDSGATPIYAGQTTLYLAGYPGGSYSAAGTRLRVSDIQARDCELDHSFVRYPVDTATGNSGGPVWVNENGRAILVGVHVASFDFEGGTGGVARRVRLSMVESWLPRP